VQLNRASHLGVEFHDYPAVEKKTGVKFYFAYPYHSWQRGSNENANGLIRQHLPKRPSMAHLTQRDCNAVMKNLDTQPGKRLAYQDTRGDDVCSLIKVALQT
jgi:IS30 family transposase